VKEWTQAQRWCHTIPYCLLIDHDRILYTGDLSNCQQDLDRFLFNSKRIAPVQHNEPLQPPVRSSSTIPDADICLMVIFSSQTLLTVEKAIIYIAGYISHKITKMVCSKCPAGLVGLLNKANSSRVLIVAKQ